MTALASTTIAHTARIGSSSCRLSDLCRGEQRGAELLVAAFGSPGGDHCTCQLGESPQNPGKRTSLDVVCQGGCAILKPWGH